MLKKFLKGKIVFNDPLVEKILVDLFSIFKNRDEIIPDSLRYMDSNRLYDVKMIPGPFPITEPFQPITNLFSKLENEIRKHNDLDNENVNIHPGFYDFTNSSLLCETRENDKILLNIFYNIGKPLKYYCYFDDGEHIHDELNNEEFIIFLKAKKLVMEPTYKDNTYNHSSFVVSQLVMNHE